MRVAAQTVIWSGLLAVALVPASAIAAPIVQTGLVGGSGNVDNVLLGSGPCTGNVTEPGTVIQGCLNTDRTYLINLESNEAIVAPSSGQARLEAVDNALSYLRISPVDGTFSKLQLNIMTDVDGTVVFSTPTGDSAPFALDAAGQNFFTIFSGDDDELAWLALTTSTGIIADVRQIRLGVGDNGVPVPDDIPEPTSMILLSGGLLGFIAARRRARSADR